ncbi:hypothetical protein AGABI2DRAFT_117989 [Agaricus bisporus var. bisporus H97]|uniref:hypothetical protein n=1 Tax=Agaricus bisporus var. bisporus (strain H97 / ATCC MYA-4626 / FGSC 10389) TaxID=936046 RepID=UPI00029F702A|nr:hypothetical protein AGABI2DRAFT_117989 [Agaricus bisporus var. bisporus H97]EKV47403.1 hypothetical protein AGABI2DRAFT_117989 [Agaricus bisporus var. bisporus H97]
MAAPLRTASPPPPSPSDSADDSADDLHLRFPQPPPIAPALRRMRSAPWHFPDAPMPDRRHSAALCYPPPPIPPRRLDNLPPPTPAPSIPLPHLPRIIRKVTSMRSEMRHPNPGIEPRRPVPKVRSFKILSRSIGVLPGTTQPSEHEVRKRTWSLSRPSRYQKTSDAPQARSSYTNWNAHTGDRFDIDRIPSDYGGFSIPYNGAFSRRAGCSTEDPFSLGLAPPFVAGATRESDLNSFYPYSRTNYSEAESVHNMSSNSPTRDRLLQRSSQHFYRLDGGNRRKNASSGAVLHGAKSFINITPERGKSGRKKSRVENSGPSHTDGNHVGSSMKERGQKVKRLLARASSGVVDWGRQLTGKSVKTMTTSSTSGSLVPLTGKHS